MWLLDVTRAIPGTERKSVERVRHLPEYPGDSKTHAIVLPGQRAMVEDLDVEIIEVQADPSAADFVEEVATTILQHGQKAFRLFTYHNDIEAELQRASEPDSSQFKVEKFPPSSNSKAAFRWPTNIVSKDDAISDLIIVLREHPTQSCRKSAVRPSLQKLNAKYGTQNGGQIARPQFIVELIHEAERRSLVKSAVVNDDASNPVITLLDVPAEGGHGSASQPLLKSGSRVSTPVRRSDVIYASLRDRNLGPFEQVRLKIYDEMETQIRDGRSKIARDLIRDAVASVRESSDGEALSTTKPFPWQSVRTFIEELCRRTRILKNSTGERIEYGISGMQEKVVSFTEGWRLRLDGELILESIRSGIDLSAHDVPEISGAIYWSRRDRFVDLTWDVLAHLQQQSLLRDAAQHDGNFSLL